MTHPAFNGILGQERVLNVLSDAMANGRIASAYLFEGPSGVGKELTAMRLASQAVAGGHPDIEYRIANSNHPDVRVFRPREEGNRNIQVEYLREEILPVAQYAPFEASRSFLIFPEADVSFPQKHPEAANAILKPLEEPRPGVTFILIAERPDRLLPTIRSRCQRLRFSRLPNSVVDSILEATGAPAQARSITTHLAQGSADKALALAQDGLAEELFRTAKEIDQAVDARRPGDIVNLADDLAKSDRYASLLQTLHAYYRDVAAAGLGVAESSWGFRHEADHLRERAARLPPARAAARAELLQATLRILESNANPTLCMDQLLFRLRDAR
jgi:DNA polymerase-3 subunit delta'